MKVDKRGRSWYILSVEEGGIIVNREERGRMDALEAIARHDPVYQELLFQMRGIEKKYNEALRRMDGEERDYVCDFVSQCEEISYYMLQLACRYMQFP